ncbi:hypothetical protein ACFQ6V_09175 [Streptomyces roseifaciens]
MPLIRKERAGSDSHGHTWLKDGSVVEVEDPEQVAALMAIPDGGFSEVTPDHRQPAPDDGGGAEFSEVDPKTKPTEAPRARRGRKPGSQE